MITLFLLMPGLKTGLENDNYFLVWNRVRIWRTGRHTTNSKEYPPSPPSPTTNHMLWSLPQNNNLIIQNLSLFEKLLLAELNFLQYNHSLTSRKQPLKIPRVRGFLQGLMTYQSRTTGVFPGNKSFRQTFSFKYNLLHTCTISQYKQCYVFC